MKKLFYWLFTVSRGYSAPMSILNWFVVFVLTIKLEPSSNTLYGIIALFGVLFAHLGTNLFDDCIDYLLKVPKQKCKTEYLDTGFTTIKTVFVVTAVYFLIALSIGVFFTFHFGPIILFLILMAGVLIITYPKLNNFALGELAVGLCFGVFLFAGINYVMTSAFNINLILISIPVSLLTVAVLYTHSLMDYDFDKVSGKFTLCQLIGSKKNSLLGLILIYFATFIISFWLIFKKILPFQMGLIIIFAPLVYKLYKNMTSYNESADHKKEDFLVNFKLARNISVFYNLILVITFWLWG